MTTMKPQDHREKGDRGTMGTRVEGFECNGCGAHFYKTTHTERDGELTRIEGVGLECPDCHSADLWETGEWL